ncbi:MAG: alanine racemase [Candidatus Eisenbacteria bacterium]|nr:alanine racemase [Candidatus Eisenbacteria bacterium]
MIRIRDDIDRLPLDRLDIQQPTLLLDRSRAMNNLTRMIERAGELGVILRPHFKTHQSLAIGRWFRDRGVRAATVSSVSMARHFSADGWNDITIAFPVNLRELNDIAWLAEKIDVGVLIDSAEAAEALDRRLSRSVRAWLKVDTGYGRAGAGWNDEARLRTVAATITSSRRLSFAGILSHNGATYHSRGPDAVRIEHTASLERLRRARAFLTSAGFGPCSISVGDTPSASLADDFSGVDEMRPGNFIFYDLTQAAIGSCSVGDVAVAVACPVTGLYPERGRLLIYGGAVHLSAQCLETEDGEAVYGRAYEQWPDMSDEGMPVVSLSQEHGMLAAETDWISRRSLGDLVYVVPVHSCLTCALHPCYLTLEGDVLDRIRG